MFAMLDLNIIDHREKRITIKNLKTTNSISKDRWIISTRSLAELKIYCTDNKTTSPKSRCSLFYKRWNSFCDFFFFQSLIDHIFNACGHELEIRSVFNFLQFSKWIFFYSFHRAGTTWMYEIKTNNSVCPLIELFLSHTYDRRLCFLRNASRR